MGTLGDAESTLALSFLQLKSAPEQLALISGSRAWPLGQRSSTPSLITRPHGAAVEPSRSFCEGRYNGPVAELCEPVYRRRTGLQHEALDRLSSSCRSGRGRAAPRRVTGGLTAGSHALTRPHPGHGTRATPRPSTDATGTDGRSTPSRTWPRTARHERQVQSVAWLIVPA
jgi:hypothetical protein